MEVVYIVLAFGWSTSCCKRFCRGWCWRVKESGRVALTRCRSSGWARCRCRYWHRHDGNFIGSRHYWGLAGKRVTVAWGTRVFVYGYVLLSKKYLESLNCSMSSRLRVLLTVSINASHILFINGLLEWRWTTRFNRFSIYSWLLSASHPGSWYVVYCCQFNSVFKFGRMGCEGRSSQLPEILDRYVISLSQHSSLQFVHIE
jgi:hypothetical protein